MAKHKKTNDIISYFGPDTTMEGEIHSNGTIHIEGSHKGSIICNGDLIIGEKSKIKGQATAKNIFISGYFEGNLEAINNLEILSTGHVEGTIKGSQLTIKEGGVYRGEVNMDVIEAQSLYEGSIKVITQ